MSIAQRLQLLLRSELGARRAPDREHEWRSLLHEARASLSALRRSEAELSAELTRLNEARSALERSAVQHLERGDEDAAREALREEIVLRWRVDELTRQRDEHRATLTDLTRSLDAAGQLADAEAEVATPILPSPRTPTPTDYYRSLGQPTQASAPPAVPTPTPVSQEPLQAPTPTAASTWTPPTTNSDPFGRFDEIERKIESLEARTSADQLLAPPLLPTPSLFDADDPLADPLDAEFRALEGAHRDREAQGRLDALRSGDTTASPDDTDPLRRLQRRLKG